jgi:hypothetical protein
MKTQVVDDLGYPLHNINLKITCIAQVDMMLEYPDGINSRRYRRNKHRSGRDVKRMKIDMC